MLLREVSVNLNQQRYTKKKKNIYIIIKNVKGKKKIIYTLVISADTTHSRLTIIKRKIPDL